MKAHTEYLKYVLRHKWFVFKACLRLGVPLYLAIVHDWTKFTPQEWGAYVRNFFNPDRIRLFQRCRLASFSYISLISRLHGTAVRYSVFPVLGIGL